MQTPETTGKLRRFLNSTIGNDTGATVMCDMLVRAKLNVHVDSSFSAKYNMMLCDLFYACHLVIFAAN